MVAKCCSVCYEFAARCCCPEIYAPADPIKAPLMFKTASSASGAFSVSGGNAARNYNALMITIFQVFCCAGVGVAMLGGAAVIDASMGDRTAMTVIYVVGGIFLALGCLAVVRYHCCKSPEETGS